MRTIFLGLILSIALPVMPVPAQESGLPEPEAQAEAPLSLSEEDLDGLFVRLAQSEDEKQAKAAEDEILRRFHTSNSDTTNLLMSWAARAMKDEKYAVALDILDRVVILQSDFAEGWNKRATVRYLKGDYEGSIEDIKRTLSLEGRHFGALSGLGLIYDSLNEKKAAIEAFRAALEINPHMESISDRLKELVEEVEGIEL